MPDAELLELFDRDERYNSSFPGLRREESGGVVRQVDLNGREGAVIHSLLSADTADAAIAAQLEYFHAIDQTFEWKVYAYDQPSDLIERLRARGFEIDQREAVMVLDLESFTPVDTPTVERITDRAGLDKVACVRQQVYDRRVVGVVQQLGFELEQSPSYLSVYLASIDGVPAAVGWIRFPPLSAFASLWGGSTVPSLRKRGLYTTLLMARIREAQARGYRFVTVDARPMSRPILERHGFRTLTYATACTYPA